MTRGRRPDPTLAPSRQLLTQRAFRQRRAAHLADLNDRINALEEENKRLTQGARASSSASTLDQSEDTASKRARSNDVKSEGESAVDSDVHRESMSASSSSSQAPQPPALTQPTCQRCSSFEQCRSEIESLVMCVGNCLGKLQYAIANLQHGEDEASSCRDASSQRQPGASGTDTAPSRSCCEPCARPKTAMPAEGRTNATSSRRTQSSAGLPSQNNASPASSSSLTAGPWATAQGNQASSSMVDHAASQASHIANALAHLRSNATQDQQGSRFMFDASRAGTSNAMPLPPSLGPLPGPQINREQWQSIHNYRQTGTFPDQQQQQSDQRQRYAHPFTGSMQNAEAFANAMQSPMFDIPNLTLPMQFSQSSATPMHTPSSHQQQQQHSTNQSDDVPRFTQSELNAVDDFGGDARKCCFGFYECDDSGNMIVRAGEGDNSGNTADARATPRQQQNVMPAPAVPARRSRTPRATMS